MGGKLTPGDLAGARAALVSSGRSTVADRLASSGAGSPSVRVGDLVTIPSGVPYEKIEPAQTCLMSLQPEPSGEPAGEQVSPASSEAPMHGANSRSTPARAAVHTHSPEVAALSGVLDGLPAVHHAVVALGGPVRVVPDTRLGPRALVDSAVLALENRTGAILGNHGAVTYGRSVSQAYAHAELRGWPASASREALCSGALRTLTETELEEVRAKARGRRDAGGGGEVGTKGASR